MKRALTAILFFLAFVAAALAQNVTVIGPVTPGNVPQFNSTTVIKDSGVPGGTGAFANPTAAVGLTAVNGAALTAMRSDAAPPLSGTVQTALTQTTGQLLIGTGGFGFSSIVLGGDCTFTSPNITCTKTGGVAFTAFATQAIPCTIAQGCTGQITAPAAISALLPTPTRAGDIVFWNGSNWVTLPGNNSGTQILSENASGVAAWTSAGAGSVQSVTCNGVTFTVSGTCPPAYGFVNCSLGITVSGNNVTYALLDNTGATPSATSPCNLYFRNATQGTGSWTQVTVTAAVTFTANAGSTFGATNTAATCAAASSCPFKTWVVAINTGSGVVLGVVDLTNASGVNPLNEATLLTTTACNACATATTLGTVYSTAVQTSRPFLILGFGEWGNGLATAGTYASAPTTIQTLGPGVYKPGQTIQDLFNSSSTLTTGSASTFTPTTPSITMTPTMNSNPVEVVSSGAGQQATSVFIEQLFRASGASAACTTGLNAAVWINSGSGSQVANSLLAFDTPGSGQQTYTVCIKSVSSGNPLYCAQTNTPSICGLHVREIMG